MKFLFLFFLPSFLISQNSEIEILINQLVQDEISKDLVDFNLIDSSYTDFPRIERLVNYDLEEIIQAQQLTDLKTTDIVLKENDSILNWSNFNIECAKIDNYKNIPKRYSGYFTIIQLPFDTKKSELDSLNLNFHSIDIYVPIKENWSKKRISKAIKNAISRRDVLFYNKDIDYYKFSKPLFNSNKKYALVALGRSHGGSYFLYKKENDRWIQITNFGFWAY